MADRDPEDQLRGIIRSALDRHREESYAGDTTGAADSVLAALADEIPDGYDDLLRTLAERQQPEPVTIVSGDMAVELPGPPDRVRDLMAAVDGVEAGAEVARQRNRHNPVQVVDGHGVTRATIGRKGVITDEDGDILHVLLDGDIMPFVYRRHEVKRINDVSEINPDHVVDLMAALERSVAEAKEARTRHGRGT